jgi:hypothetical protein
MYDTRYPIARKEETLSNVIHILDLFFIIFGFEINLGVKAH